MKIFIAKLSPETESDDLQACFQEHGGVTSADVIKDKFSGRSRCFGFVEMEDDDEARSAIQALNDTEFQGNTIVVQKAEPRKERS